jgi:enoyl-CoA hydratase/carnithine racemase
MTDILVDKSGGICRITFNRPDKKNAITAAMYDVMTAAMHDAENDTSVRIVVFAANGAAFTAGNDLVDFMQAPPTGPESSVFRFLVALREAKKPLVAAVQGTAIGIGVTMLLHCDAVYAANVAKFSAPFSKLGLCPEAGSSLLLPAMAGHAKAAEVLMFGDTFDAAFARDIGLVSTVVASSELMAFVEKRCAVLLQRPPASLRLTKELMRAPMRAQLQAVMEQEAVHFMERLGSAEAREAFTSFFEGRPANFSQFH